MMSTTTDWIEIGPLEEISPLGSRIVKHPAGDIAIFRTEGDKVYALDNKCPHKGGPLSEGIVAGCRITCPLHNWVMELETGLAIAPDEGQVPTHEIRLTDGIVFLKLQRS